MLTAVASMIDPLSVAATPVVGGAAAVFVKHPMLKISPSGRYVYYEEKNGPVFLSEVACLKQKSGECPVYAIQSRQAFPRNTSYFSRDDRFLYLADVGTSAARSANGALTIREFDMGRLLAGDRVLPRRTFTFRLSKDIEHDIDITTDFSRMSDAATQRLVIRSTPLLDAATAADSTSAANVSNVFGLLDGSRFVMLRRADADYQVYCRTAASGERLLWSNGTAFYSRMSNLPFKFDGADPIVQATGGILRLTGCKVNNLTANLPGAWFIEGDDPAGYYGFFTSLGVTPAHVDRALSVAVSASVERLRDEHVTGVAINNRHRLSVISHGPYRTVEGSFPRLRYSHDLTIDGRSIKLVAPGAPMARHELISVDNGRIFVERYSRIGNRKHVLYLYGGPGRSGNLALAAWSDMLAVLDAGADLDIVHYSGSSYTFALKDRLFRDGTESIAADAAAIERYVARTYPRDAFVAMRLNSFGGLFYRHFTPAFLGSLKNVVLDQPAGSIKLPETNNPIAQIFNPMNMGKDVPAVNTQYYRDLQSCQVSTPVTIIIGRNDKKVDPEYDYRFCRTSPMVRWVYHDFDHLDNSGIFPQSSLMSLEDRAKIYRMIASELIREPENTDTGLAQAPSGR